MNYRIQSGEVGSIRVDSTQYKVYITTYGTMRKMHLDNDTIYCLKDFCPIDGLLTEEKMPAFIQIPGDKYHQLYLGYITNNGKVHMPRELRKTVSLFNSCPLKRAETSGPSRNPYDDGLPIFDFNTFVASINVDYAEYTRVVDTYMSNIKED